MCQSRMKRWEKNPVNIASRLVKVGRYSGEEKDTADLVCEIMEELGYDQIIKTKSGSIIGIIGPEDEDVEILFDSHIDIATVSGEWSFDPFCGEVKDDKLLGRGTSDMKSGLAASLYAVSKYAKEHKLKKRIAVSATVMEETIEGLGLEEVVKECSPKNVVICEPSELDVMIGQKGRMEIMLTINGKSAHASNPEIAINPMLIASRALLALDNMNVPNDDILGDGILVPTDMITEPYPAISIIPEKVKIRFDKRNLPGETEESVLNDISNVLEHHGINDYKLEIVEDEFTTYTGEKYKKAISLLPWSISKDEDIFKAMYESASKVLKPESVKVSAWACCTNGSQCAGRDKIKTIGMGPGSIKQAHIVDEFINIDDIINVTNIYYHFISIMLN